MFFFFKQKTAYGMRISDWSADVCSSDLRAIFFDGPHDLSFSYREGAYWWAGRYEAARLSQSAKRVEPRRGLTPGVRERSSSAVPKWRAWTSAMTSRPSPLAARTFRAKLSSGQASGPATSTVPVYGGVGRTSVGKGMRVSVRVELGGCGMSKK